VPPATYREKGVPPADESPGDGSPPCNEAGAAPEKETGSISLD
jgi:hypothetical protein